jgi:hypothetical protein
MKLFAAPALVLLGEGKLKPLQDELDGHDNKLVRPSYRTSILLPHVFNPVHEFGRTVTPLAPQASIRQAAEYILFSVGHGIVSKIDHILGHKVNFNSYKNIEIDSCILSHHNGIQLEISNKIATKNVQTHRD